MKILIFSLGFFLLSVAPCGFAVEPSEVPDSSEIGVIESKITEEAREQILYSKPVGEVEIEEEEKPFIDKKEAVFLVKEIRLIRKIKLLEDHEEQLAEIIEPLLSDFENTEMTFSKVQKLTKIIEREYRKMGYFSLVFIPPQRMEDGVLTLEVLISNMGELSVEGNRFFWGRKIKSYWKTKPGEILNYEAIVRDVIALNENPDRKVRPILKAGNETGTTDVVLKVEDKFPVHVGYSLDNQGANLTGKLRTGFTLRNNNMLGLDDIFVIGTVFGDAFGALFLQHMIPLNTTGTSLIYNFSHAQVNPKKEFDRFGINGISQNYGLRVQQRLVKRKKWSAKAYVAFDFKEKKNRILSVTNTRDRLRVLSFGADGSALSYDGVTKLKQDFYFGIPLNGDGFPLNTRGGETQFFKYKFLVERQQKLPGKTRLVAKLQGQLSESRLMPQEQLGLGGATTIRGFPESDFLADQGLITNIEFWMPLFVIPSGWKLPYAKGPLREQIKMLTFLDYGYGRVNDPSATERHTRNILSAGGGLQIRFRKNLSGRFEWGVPLFDRAITESGKSQFHFRLTADI